MLIQNSPYPAIKTEQKLHSTDPIKMISDDEEDSESDSPTNEPCVTMKSDADEDDDEDEDDEDDEEEEDEDADADDDDMFESKSTAEKRPKDTRIRKRKRTNDASTLNISCDICSKKFFKLHRLEGHLRQHQGLKVNAFDMF